MNEKMYTLLEKVYGEVVKTNERMDNLENEVKDTKSRVIKIETSLENEVSNKVRALFDNREVVKEKLEDIDDKIDNVSLKINNLTLTAVKTDTELIEIKRNLKMVK